MVDTQVLIYAARNVTSRTDAANIANIRAAKALIGPLKRIPVSAIVASEFVPFASDDTLWDRLEIIQFDGAQARFAAGLAKKLRANPAMCPKCLGPRRTPKTCEMCKNQQDRRSAEPDLRIAAAAECTGFGVLYSFESWLVERVSPLLKQSSIKKPPAYSDGPLLEWKKPDSERPPLAIVPKAST